MAGSCGRARQGRKRLDAVRKPRKHYGGIKMEGEKEYTQLALEDFLKDLNESDSINVSDWEANFIESNLENKSFSDGQVTVIKSLIDKYGHRMKCIS